MRDTEKLHEALQDAARHHQTEQEERSQLEALLHGLRVLNSTESVDEIFVELIAALRPMLEYETAFVLLSDRYGTYRPHFSSEECFLPTVWQPSQLLHRVEMGQCVACFDVSQISDWQAQGETILNKVGSALMVPLGVPENRGILVAVHSKRAFFYQKHIRFAKRIVPLVEQAIIRALAISDVLAEEVRIRTMMEQMFDGILTLDSEGCVLSSNASAQRQFARGNLLGIPFLDLLSNKTKTSWPLFISQHQEALRQGLELIGVRPPSNEFPIEVRLSQVQLRNESFYLTVVRDVSDKRRLEGQLIQAQKMEALGTMAAGLAHEINTPIQYIRDNTAFLRDEFKNFTSMLDSYKEFAKASSENQDLSALRLDLEKKAEELEIDYLVSETPKAIEQTLAGAESVAQIVRSMKEFSHPGGKEKDLVDINAALENVITVSRNEWKYVADVKMELDHSINLVKGFRGELNQVFLNLIINSAQAISEITDSGKKGKGLIKISSKARKDSVEVQISDTGGGIPEAVGTRVFDPFFTTKGVGKGTGLGLAFAHTTIVEKHKGNISFQSSTGKGTVFTITLPLNA